MAVGLVDFTATSGGLLTIIEVPLRVVRNEANFVD